MITAVAHSLLNISIYIFEDLYLKKSKIQIELYFIKTILITGYGGSNGEQVIILVFTKSKKGFFSNLAINVFITQTQVSNC
jgi:hypothetical protein